MALTFVVYVNVIWLDVFNQYTMYSVKNILGYGTVLFKSTFSSQRDIFRRPVFLLHTVNPETTELYQHCQDESSFSQ
jgi:hypothetical protein